MKLAVLILFQLALFYGCAQQSNRKFIWKTGPEPKNNYRYNIALSSGPKIYTIGGDNAGSFETFDTGTNSWNTLPGLPTPRMFISGTILNNSVFVIGGIDSSLRFSAKNEKYDLSTNAWTVCEELNQPRSRLAVVAFRNKIYAIGGFEGKDDQSGRNSAAFEEYDPLLNTWTIKKNMPTARHGHSAIVVHDKILVVGGYTEHGPTAVVEEYDPNTETWTIKTVMPTARGFFGLALIENNVYAMAGRVQQNNGPIEAYHYHSDSWETLGPMPFQRNRFGITSIKNTLYIIGGENYPKSFLIAEIK